MKNQVVAGVALIGLLFTGNVIGATFSVSSVAEFQAALTTAQANGEDDTINVATGTYNVETALTYQTSEAFALIIQGQGTAASGVVLDGGALVQVMYLDNTASGDITTRNLTIQNGNVTTGDAPTGGGAAVLCGQSGNVNIDNCVIVNNVSAQNAGGIYVSVENGTATVTNCVIEGNSTDASTGDDGGGIDLYVPTDGTGNIILSGNTIVSNSLPDNPEAVGNCDGAGVFIYHLGTGSVTITNNVISGNVAPRGAGGLFCRMPVSGTFTLIDNAFSGNSSGGESVSVWGGGAHVHMENGDAVISGNQFLENVARGADEGDGGGLSIQIFTSGSLTMSDNFFVSNHGDRHGGGASTYFGSGVSSVVIANNAFAKNSAGATDGSGGGLILNGEVAAITLDNNTFYDNTAGDAGGLAYYSEASASTLNIYNDIYWDNEPNAISLLGAGEIAAAYCDIEDGSEESWFGAGCVDVDPLFFDVTNLKGADGVYGTNDDGLRLTTASALINAGNSAYVPSWLDTDIAGNPRVKRGSVDMGAYETIYEKVFEQDFNGDGKADLLMVNVEEGSAYIYLMNGVQTLGQGQVFSGLTGWRVATVGDFDGDGKSDLALRESSSGALYICLMDGATIAERGFLLESGGAGWSVAGNGDLNGDGKDDLILVNDSSGALFGFIMDGISASTQNYIIQDGASSWRLVGVGDFNGDGKSDLCLQAVSRGDIIIGLMDGLTISSYGYAVESASSIEVLVLGDFNDDGKTDLALGDESGDTWVGVMNGYTVSTSAMIIENQPDWDALDARDINGDGKADLVYRNKNTNYIYGLIMNGAAIARGGFIYSGSSDWVAQNSLRDVNGDGKADLICDNAAYQWAIALLNGLTVTGSGVPFTGAEDWDLFLIPVLRP